MRVEKRNCVPLGTLPKLSKEESEQLFPRYPSDGGFLEAYQTNQPELYVPVLKKYGFVVIQLLSEEECNQTLQEFLRDANENPEKKQVKRITLEDPSSWENINWPDPKGKFLFQKKALGQKVFDNRTNPKLYEFYKNVFGGEEKLWCAVDPHGVMRGTKGLRMIKGGRETIVDRDDWRTNLNMHWDCNPWKYVQETVVEKHHPMYQGLVALVDCPEEVGGFLCVPGSTAYLQTWAQHHKPEHSDTHSALLPSDDELIKHQQRVPLKRGQMVVWDSGQAHANFPNYSDRPRIVQFLRLAVACDKESCSNHRFLAINHLRDSETYQKINELELTELGRKLVGLDSWD